MKTEHSFIPSVFIKNIQYHVRYSAGKQWDQASKTDIYNAVARSVRERLIDAMLDTEHRYTNHNAKRLYYLSMEFLLGRFLGNNIYNLDITEIAENALKEIGIDLEEVRNTEVDAALGNGGLGRLAACFLDSLATLGMPGYGYGINYEFGLFKQEIINGYQQEKPDHWYSEDNPWLIEKADEKCFIPVYGRIDHAEDMKGQYNPMWMGWNILVGVPYDVPIVGYGGKTVNYLRLFAARSSDDFDMQIFNEGDYFKAVEQKISSENVSKVLYPSDSFAAGRELRLLQEYFLVACAVRDITRKYLACHTDFDRFSEKVAIQLNDTHPALTVTELMRTLVDENDLTWETAWDITQNTLGYTNHTLLPEALETWPVSILERVIPRHLQIIYEINHRFLKQMAPVFKHNPIALQNMSIIGDGDDKQVRMANLSIIGSHAVNGVAEVHSNLVKTSLFPDFYKLWPQKFSNKTNGVTQRRWLLKSNPGLSGLISEKIGHSWITDLYQLTELESHLHDSAFPDQFRRIKKASKEQLAKTIYETSRVAVNTDSLFDVQIKRMHEYKRQLLNVMQIIHQYLGLIEDQKEPAVPRTYIFAGKAAPGYFMAKLIIKLINSVADTINRDSMVNDRMKVVLIPDYKVSLAEKIIPAADLSEQISTAGMEASGTGNMKLMLNGALTIGTLDGANIEIMEEVGAENIYIFGLNVNEIQEMRRTGAYTPQKYYTRSPDIKRVLDSIGSGRFNPKQKDLFKPIVDTLLKNGDYYFHLADFEAYAKTQAIVSADYNNHDEWTRKALTNIARSGKFSSDRTITEYANDIWHIEPVL